MDRKLIAQILEDCGTLLELKGENSFRCNAYHNAARAILQYEGDLDELAAAGKLATIKGVGKAVVSKIEEIARTGDLALFSELRKEIPTGLVEMLRISGFGPKRIRVVYDTLGVDTIEGLRIACNDGRVAAIKGFGAKSAAKILKAIEFLEVSGQRVLLPVALELAVMMRDALAGHPAVKQIEWCGSLRRGRETIKDIDLLVASDDPDPIMKRFVEHPSVIQVTGHGPTKSSVLLESGVPADLRVVTAAQFPFALLYFTGSKAHNVAMRALAQEHGLKLNEYELAGPDGCVECKEEEEIFAALGLDYIPPELREDTGEIAAAASRTLPKLIRANDLVGTFHCHTNASDGKATLEEMVEGAKQRGLMYLGIADHSQSAFYAGGLKPDRVRHQHEMIDALNARQDGFRIFKGIESDILADGSLDYDEATLASFDYIVASVHQPMNMDEKTMTERVVRAIRHPRCTMLGHATGRLLLQRDPYPIDLERVLIEAAKAGTMIEINANPRRLELDWVFCKRAKSLGIKIAINPDAHAVNGLDDLRYGVWTARRGWLEKDDIFNTLSTEEVAAEFERRRNRAS